MKQELKWTQGDKGAIPGEPWQELGDKAALIETEGGKWYVMLKDGKVIMNPKSQGIIPSPLFDDTESAKEAAMKALGIEEPKKEQISK